MDFPVIFGGFPHYLTGIAGAMRGTGHLHPHLKGGGDNWLILKKIIVPPVSSVGKDHPQWAGG